MSIRLVATIAVALFLGLVAVLILNATIGGHKSATAATSAGTTPVVVAVAPIARGATLQPTMLKVVAFPSSAAPTGAFSSIDELAGAKTNGRLAMRSLGAGEAVLANAVTGPGGKLTLASVIAPGMQAVSVRTTDVTGVGGFVLPGDRVDVLLTRTMQQGGEQNPFSVTQIVAENVLVLGVDQEDNNESDKPVVVKAVTIEASPAQAQVITLGQTVGTVSLTLRHVADDEPQLQKATTVAQLGYAPRPAPAPRRAPAAAQDGQPHMALYGPGIVRVTRVTDITPYRVGR